MLRSFFSRHAKGIVVASNIAVQAGIQVWIKKNRAEDAPQAPLTDEKADRGKAQPPTFFWFFKETCSASTAG